MHPKDAPLLVIVRKQMPNSKNREISIFLLDRMLKLVYNPYRQVVGKTKEGDTVGNGKEAEERKKEILDIAEELFVSKGYEGTSTTDILERVGIARGTLYYHFKSKEEILDALIDRTMQAIVQNIRQALAKEMPAPQKILSFIVAMKLDTAIGREITEYAHKPQNALMHQKIQDMLFAVITPIAAGIIREGIAEGCFHTDYPEEAAEMLLVYSMVVFDEINELAEDIRARKAAGFIFNMERLLGTAPGSLSELLQCI